MTAPTVHTRHAQIPDHPHLDRLGDRVDASIVWLGRLPTRSGRLTWRALRWTGRILRRASSAVVDFVDAHWEAVAAALVTAVGLSVVTGVAVWMTLSDVRIWPMGVVFFGGGMVVIAIGHWAAGGRK